MFEEKIPMKIFGQTYEILGDPGEALYYNSLARFVEDRMKEILDHTNIVSSQKIAVLAALNIADELFQEREKKSLSGKSSEKKFDELIHVLDSALETAAKAPPAPVAHKPHASAHAVAHAGSSEDPVLNLES